MQDRFEVEISGLGSASRNLSGVAEQLRQAAGELWAMHVGAFPASGAAGPALAGLVAAWQAAAHRLAEAADIFARNTQVAAVRYEQTDRSTIPVPVPASASTQAADLQPLQA